MWDIPIFKTGQHTDASGTPLDFNVSDLEQIATDYNTDFHEAPLVLGHPKADHPAFGWVKGLKVKGQELVAQVAHVSDSLKEAVRDGHYKKVSASFYLPSSKFNPKKSGYYLRHVGILGAMPPAVKGLGSLSFNEAETDADYIDFTDQGILLTPKGDIQLEEKIKELELKAQALQVENETLKSQLEQQVIEKKEAEHAAFCEQLIQEGRLTPALKESALALLNAPHTADFSEQTQLEQFKAFLSELPVSVSFSEIATKEDVQQDQDDGVSYAEGVNEETIMIDKKVRQYMKRNKVSYSQAFDELFA